MLYSSSIRYGGILVHASDCNEDSFKSLGLICPECGKIVYWRSPAERAGFTKKNGTKVEATKVPAFFSHFPTSDKEEDESDICEARVKNYGKLDVDKSKQKATAQRRKDFEARLFRMFSFNPKINVDLGFLFKAAELDFTTYLGQGGHPVNHLKKYKKLYARQIRGNKPDVLKRLRVIGDTPIPIQDSDTPIQDRLHLQVCFEVIEYLWQPSNSGLLEELTLLALYVYLADRIKVKEGSDESGLDFARILDARTLLTQQVFKEGSGGILLQNKTYIAPDFLGAIAFFFAMVIFETDWASAFSFYDRLSPDNKRPFKLRFCNAIAQQGEQASLLVLPSIERPARQQLFDYDAPLYTIENPNVENLFKVRSLGYSPSLEQEILEQALRLIDLEPERVYISTAFYYTADDVTCGAKCDVKLLTNSRPLPMLLDNFDFADGFQVLADGFFYTNMKSKTSRNYFARRFNKIMKGKKYIDKGYYASSPTVIVENFVDERLVYPFVCACTDYLSNFSTSYLQ